MTDPAAPTTPTRDDFVKAAEDRIASAMDVGPGFLRTAIRVELLSMWDAAEARSAPAEALDVERLAKSLGPYPQDPELRREKAERIAAEYARLRSPESDSPMSYKCDCGHALRDHYANPNSDALPQPCADCPCDHFVEGETDD